MFRASLRPSSGEQECALPHMVSCTGCDGCGSSGAGTRAVCTVKVTVRLMHGHMSLKKRFRMCYNLADFPASDVSCVTPCLYSSLLTGAAHASYSCSVFSVCSWLNCSSSSGCCLILQNVRWREFSNFVFVVALRSSEGETEIILCRFIKGTVEKYTSRGHLRTGS